MNACSCCPQLAVVSQWGKETGEGGTGCIYSSEWTPGLWKNWTLEGKGLIIYSGRFLDTEASSNKQFSCGMGSVTVLNPQMLSDEIDPIRQTASSLLLPSAAFRLIP